ncbi:hypothetical protein BG262_08305 [Floricoccus penangensis]|uniref:BIG2 domain-containing protein n=1 Tax=Floricoccus penangensis TaxID=1859475 RepID=A0A9Q5P145_9LACT|nr:serine hydrolase [Floricoccus penangensis]OFI47697.1 hypothetical protein BG262_08305 [Floricoccus penangensis]
MSKKFVVGIASMLALSTMYSNSALANETSSSSSENYTTSSSIDSQAKSEQKIAESTSGSDLDQSTTDFSDSSQSNVSSSSSSEEITENNSVKTADAISTTEEDKKQDKIFLDTLTLSKKIIAPAQEQLLDISKVSQNRISQMELTSSDGKIVKIDKTGKIVGVSVGKAKIKIEFKDTKESKIFDIEVIKPSILYKTHIQNIGWEKNYKTNGEMSGTEGRSLRLEAIEIKLKDITYDGSIKYQTHVQDYGWQDWKTEGQISGTSGQSKRLEGIRLSLTGELAQKYDIYYRTHVQNIGWLDWAKNGEASGSQGLSARLEGIEIQLVEKDKGSLTTKRTFVNGSNTNLIYQVHVQNNGWQDWRSSGQIAGTTGSSLRLEALRMKMVDTDLKGGISYQSHVQNIGWQNSVANGEMSGTSGMSYRMEAVKINLTGEISGFYDVYYRAHVQDRGWLGWTKNGQPAGSEGVSKRVEAIEVKLVHKDQKGPNLSNSLYTSEVPQKMARVQNLLNRKYNNQSYGIYVMSENGQYSASINGNTQFIAASTGKLPGIYYTQKRLNNGSLRLNQQWNYNGNVNNFSGAYQPWGAGVMSKYPDYRNYSVDTVLHNTIKYSDNVGANFLGYYGANSYDQTFLREINRITGRNWSFFTLIASARDNARLMKGIYDIGGISNTYFQNTVYDNERIPKYLPVKVGHKIGDVYDYRHDVAVVYTKEPYFISIMTKNNTSYETISRISKDVYDILK